MGSGNDCGSDREAARVGLNGQLREVALATQGVPHADCFLLPVDVLNLATDYHAFVDPRNGTVCLEQLLSRTRSCFYTSVHEFRREYEQMLANALAYNSPGHGRHAHKPVIGWAQSLLDACVLELARRPQLAALEQRLKEASRADSGGKDSAQASPRSNKMSTSTACPLSSMEALVAACEMAAEQEGLEQDDTQQQFYLGMVAAGDGYELAQDEEGMGEAGSGSGSGSGVCGHEGDLQVTRMKRQGSGGEAAPGGGRGKGGGRAAAAAAALDSAPKYRRHKSKVYIRPNKVVYLPTTFMEENFDPSSLPVNCEMIVETNGGVQPDRHRVTIKAVPRQGLATMYCMTNVMKFQQQFLNWQILNWTKMDEQHIKIHLQSPDGCSKGTRMDSEEADVVPPAPAACNKRKGGARGRDVYDMGAGCEQEAEDAMDLDQAGGAAAGTLGADQPLAAYQQDQQQQQANLHQRHGKSAATSPRGARGGRRRGGAKATANTSEGSGGGAAGELGSGTSSPFHHDPHDRDLLEGGYGGAQTSGSGEEVCGDREVGSSERGGSGSGGSAEGAAQRSHELELSPAHSGGSDSGGTGTAVQPGRSQGQGGQQAVHQQQQQQQQQVEVQQFEGQQQVQQAQQAPHLLQQQLHMPYPQPLPFGPPGFGFGAWPLWGPGAPPPPLMVPGPGGPLPLDAMGMPPMPPMPLGCGTFETAQQQSQRYATAMMLLQQLPVAAAAQPSALPGMLAGLGCLPIPPLRTTLMNAAAGADGCNSSNSSGTVALPMASSSAYKRCKTTSGSSAEAATAASAGSARPGMLPPLPPLCPGATPAGIAPDVELSCLSMPGLLAPDVVAMATALAGAAAKGDAAASGRGKWEMDVEGQLPQAAQLQHAFTM